MCNAGISRGWGESGLVPLARLDGLLHGFVSFVVDSLGAAVAACGFLALVKEVCRGKQISQHLGQCVEWAQDLSRKTVQKTVLPLSVPAVCRPQAPYRRNL